MKACTNPESFARLTSSGDVLSVRYSVINGVKSAIPEAAQAAKMRSRYALAAATVVTGGRRFGMTIARRNTFAVAPITADSAGPSRRCRCQSSGRVSVTRDGVTVEDMGSTLRGDYKDGATRARCAVGIQAGGWQEEPEESYNRLFRRPVVAPQRKAGIEEQEPRMAAKTATATAPAPAKKVRELSEEELLAAPEKDYMNEAQLAFFKKRLLELRDQLLQNADDTGEHLRENEITTDPSDRATLEEEYTLELRTRDRERKLLKKVEKSLRLIEDGSYGWCEETGEPIGVPRLLARPTATLSLEAQERRERVQKLYGDD